MTPTARSSELDQIATTIRGCQLCPLAATRCYAVPGEGPIDAEIMLVGEAPGRVNDEVGRPFVGHGGAVLDGILKHLDISRPDTFITNAVKCWPPENRRPKPHEFQACRPYLERQVDLVRPRIIFALGSVAFAALTGQTIKMKSEHGKVVSRNGVPVCAVFHPNGLRYVKGGRATLVNAMNAALVDLPSVT